MERSATKRLGGGGGGFGEVLIFDKTDRFKLDFVEKTREDLGAPPQTWEKYFREGQFEKCR